MKLAILFLGVTVLAVACTSKSKHTEPAPSETAKAAMPAKTKMAGSTTPARTTSKAATRQTSSATSGTMASESANTAEAKEGWSKTAKGAVIGGVVGAGTGAVVNKRNRAVGAVVGGVAGAGAGAIIGNEMDKKDGRH